MQATTLHFGASRGRARTDLPTAALAPFVLLTFAVTWGVTGLYILAPESAAAWFGSIGATHPLWFTATWGPAIAAVVLVLGHGGPRGLRAFLSRLLMWRVPGRWAGFVLVGVPLVFVAGSLIEGGPLLAPVPAGGIGPVLTVTAIMLFLGPVEELGWRGTMQPLLQRRMAPLWAAMVVGAVWGLWHLPAFHMTGTLQSGWGFWPFFAGNIALAVIATPILNAGRGGLLWPVLLHWQLINPIWPDARPWDTWLLAVVAALVVWTNRAAMLAKGSGTEVVIPGADGAGDRS